jgi:hypothetical protein
VLQAHWNMAAGMTMMNKENCQLPLFGFGLQNDAPVAFSRTADQAVIDLKCITYVDEG